MQTGDWYTNPINLKTLDHLEVEIMPILLGEGLMRYQIALTKSRGDISPTPEVEALKLEIEDHNMEALEIIIIEMDMKVGIIIDYDNS